MPTLFESLESRALFSVASAVAAVQADVAALQSIGTTALPQVKADVVAVRAEAAALPKTPQNRKLIAAFKRDGNRVTVQGAAAGKQLSTAVTKQQSGLIAAATAVVLNPSDAKAQAKLTALVKRAEKSSAAPLARLRTALTDNVGLLTADAAALMAANPTDPTLAAAVSQTQSDLTSLSATGKARLDQTAADIATLRAAFNG